MPKPNKTQAASVDDCHVQERYFPLTLFLA